MIPFEDIEYGLRNPQLGGDKSSERVDVGDLIEALRKLYGLYTELYGMVSQNAPLSNPNANAVNPGDVFFDPEVRTDSTALEDAENLEHTLDHLNAAYTPADPSAWTGYVTFNDSYQFTFVDGSWAPLPV